MAFGEYWDTCDYTDAVLNYNQVGGATTNAFYFSHGTQGQAAPRTRTR